MFLDNYWMLPFSLYSLPRICYVTAGVNCTVDPINRNKNWNRNVFENPDLTPEIEFDLTLIYDWWRQKLRKTYVWSSQMIFYVPDGYKEIKTQIFQTSLSSDQTIIPAAFIIGLTNIVICHAWSRATWEGYQFLVVVCTMFDVSACCCAMLGGSRAGAAERTRTWLQFCPGCSRPAPVRPTETPRYTNTNPTFIILPLFTYRKSYKVLLGCQDGWN